MNEKVIIIAEAGVNHNGDMTLARQLIDAAAEAGVDFVKFQTFIPHLLVSNRAAKAEYQKQNTQDGSQIDMLNQLALTHLQFRELKDYCDQKNIGFLSTGFDDQSVRFIDNLGVEYHKIPSGEITNLPYLQLVGSLRKKVILSTGMATLDEVKTSVKVLKDSGTNEITILHCTTEYPAPPEEVNLRAIETMRKELGLRTGYSDHTQGIVIPIAAVAMGAVMIEKHFTLSRELPGPDHKASLEPSELTEMVKSIRLIEKAFGDGIKQPTASEVKNIKAARRSIHLKHSLPKGHILTEDDLIMKRPGEGISPMRFKEVIGKTLNSDLPADTMLNENHIQ
jgi:N-acetylneuraminate synthase